MKSKEASGSETVVKRRLLTFCIAGDVGELSPNRRLHPLQRARLAKKWRTHTQIALKDALDRTPFYALRVQITFTLRRGRMLDPDNAAACTKSLTDGMKGYLFPDDTAAHVEYGPIQQEVSARYRLFPEVEVRVEEAPGD